MKRAFPEDGEARENFRMRVENALFVQLLVGGRLERQGRNAKFLSLMAFITLAPVILLLLLENWFLTYHSWRITWWHRFLLAVDLGLVWILWPAYRSTWGFVRFQPKKSWRLVLPGVLSAAALAFAVAMARFPDEPVRLFWPFENAAPYSTLTLVAEDLVDSEKVARIEKNESLAVTERWGPDAKLDGRELAAEAWG